MPFNIPRRQICIFVLSPKTKLRIRRHKFLAISLSICLYQSILVSRSIYLSAFCLHVQAIVSLFICFISGQESHMRTANSDTNTIQQPLITGLKWQAIPLGKLIFLSTTLIFIETITMRTNIEWLPTFITFHGIYYIISDAC